MSFSQFGDIARTEENNYIGLCFVFEFSSDHEVQHLIEKCLIFRMSKDECMEALFKHANIQPVITSTVWNELEKENQEFFESYSQSRSQSLRRADLIMSESETSQVIQKIISEHQGDASDNDGK